MATPPRVSIITPTYNHEAFLKQCIESCIAQTYDGWEQIVIDDGSTDETRAAVSGIRDRRVRYVRQEHAGISHLADIYNKGLSMARGSLIAILEGDDFWPPDKLERQVPAFADADLVLSWGMAGQVDPSGNLLGVGPELPIRPSTRVVVDGAGAALHRLLDANYIPACTVICRRDALLEVHGFSQPHGIPTADYPTWLKLSCLGTVVPGDGILGFWRRHPAQITSVMETEMLAIPRFAWASWIAADLSPDEQARLGLLERQTREIDAVRRAQIDFADGREALRRQRRRIARAFFKDALRYGRGRMKGKAFVALACTQLGVDLEAVVRLRDFVTRAPKFHRSNDQAD